MNRPSLVSKNSIPLKIFMLILGIYFITINQFTFAQQLIDNRNESIRPLLELNTPDAGESYPFISEDGLRIYYNSGSIATGNIFFSSRPNLASPFSKAQLLSNKFPSGSHSAYLSKDELAIYFVVNNTIYTSKRDSKHTLFTTISKINLSGDFFGFISGVSVTPDTKELLVYNTNSSTNRKRILTFKSEGPNNYKLSGHLPIPLEYEAGSGRLSTDGLEFHLSVEKNKTNKLASFKRRSLSKPFEKFNLLECSINDFFNNIQPSKTLDNRVLVFVRNSSLLWNQNDLYIYEQTPLGISDEILFSEPFPNPTEGVINFTLSESVSFLNVTISAVDGRPIKTTHVQPISNQISISAPELNNGVYIITLKSPKKIVSKKIVISKK
jgi:hypothetical protein